MTFQLRKLLSVAALACLGTTAQAGVLTFETGFVGASTGPEYFRTLYEGFQFGALPAGPGTQNALTDWFYTDESTPFYFPNSPNHFIATDPLNFDPDPFAPSQGITRTTDFTFVGAWFAGFDEIKFSLYNDGMLVCTSANGTEINTRTTTFVASCSGAAVDEVRVLGSQTLFAMDDFTFEEINAVPEPTSLALVGLAGLVGFGATRRKAGAKTGATAA